MPNGADGALRKLGDPLQDPLGRAELKARDPCKDHLRGNTLIDVTGVGGFSKIKTI
jgi:hypothetical protein